MFLFLDGVSVKGECYERCGRDWSGMGCWRLFFFVGVAERPKEAPVHNLTKKERGGVSHLAESAYLTFAQHSKRPPKILSSVQ